MHVHNASCCAMCMSELKKDYGWIEHESVYLPWEDSPQCAFFWALSGSLLALLASFVHWLCCFHFLNVANRRLRSALNSAKHVRYRRPVALSSASSIVKKRRSSLGPVLDLYRQCTWRMSFWACIWNAVRNKNPKLTRQRVSLQVDL